uniref:Photosystem II reaction center protein U n=1 Tax=Chroomonas placoidea TaxID=173977 RepID=UPI0032B08EBF
LIAALAVSASAFSPAVPALRTAPQACGITMQAESVDRRGFLGALGAAVVAAPLAASANVEYPNVPYLGGSDIIDVNNANVRVYTRLPGMYPAIAKKIIKRAPYKDINEMLEKGDFTAAEKDILDKYLPNLTALEPAPEYVIDNINNGLYR